MGTGTLETLMESGITVELLPPTPQGRLWPRYDADADILVAESPFPREWPYGIDIDGRIIFDIDKQRRLANFDLHIPRRLWKVRQGVGPPTRAREHDIMFTTETLNEKSFSIDLEVTTNSERTEARILFGERPALEAVQAVKLSDQCFAYVDGGRLAGFYVSL